jgi:hypothetical protein
MIECVCFFEIALTICWNFELKVETVNHLSEM